MSPEPGFARLQAEFAASVRDPSLPPPAGLEARRLAVYREVFFNNVRDFLDAAFPVVKSLLPAPEWDALLRDFFAGHRAQSPYFRDIPLEFRQWLERCRGECLASRPWLAELLHYEWAELAADCAEVEPDPAACTGDLLAGLPLPRRATWPLAYRWPVHALGPGSPPAATPPAAPTFLLLWRDAAGVVHRREVTALAARLLELLLQGQGGNGRALLEALALEAGLDGAAMAPFVERGAALLEELQEEGLILGVRCDNRSR